MTNSYYLRICFFFSLFFLITFNNDSYTQTFNGFGIKGGFLASGLSTFNQEKPYTLDKLNLYLYDESDYYNFINFDIGVYTEWFNSKEFCISAELHYSVKGEKGQTLYTLPSENAYDSAFGLLTDEAGYLSLQILPRYRAGISKKGKDNIYFFAGPVFNFMVSNMSSYTQSRYIVTKGFMQDVGAAVGIGFEIEKTYVIELKLDYNFTGSYDFEYGNEKISRGYNSFFFLTGIKLSNLFTKNKK